MKPIETLMTEHRVIEQVLSALERYVSALPQDNVDTRATLARFVKFIREFADACHHGKEEDILFATMEEHGFPRDMGPLAVMLAEHSEGRRLVKQLKEAAEKVTLWDARDREQIAHAAQAYIGLLRQHILKEDRILYPTAERMLDAQTFETIESRFEEFEQKETGVGEHERLHALADELIAEFGSTAGASHDHHGDHPH